ncbi:MAG: NIPSNAP family protein [Bryobacteraceae bacterium]|nr:NIPSNAP family protein [Bryobacteraceae bacterium]
MYRRNFLAAAAAGAAVPLSAQAPKKSIVALSWIRFRNSPDQQMQRTREFVTQSFLPAYKRAGSGPIGVFSNAIGPDSPSMLVVSSYPDLASIDALEQKLMADREFRKAAEAYNSMPGLGYQRAERSLLRGFDSMPNIEVPPTEGRTANRIFELRTYESNNAFTLRRKMKMFDDGEIGIFRRLNMLPVFFGETIVGTNMPNLTYMLAFDSLAAREKAWQAFGQDPEWQKMRVLPGLSDSEVVSNISNWIVSPLPGSDIR